ncbi:uncharacterized protein LOC113566351 [Drosophila persimilis]|uniref:uncharacterized protein LOC113566351 n=1 Tax=Drosophila persimilis TaxID=7234 RepID=UPI000F07F09F|nr:uncharacterized protein LOC113566351 [Drosophila persimilis]
MKMPTSYQIALTFALVLGHVQLQGVAPARVIHHSQVHRRANTTRLTPAHTHHVASNHTRLGQARRLNNTSSVSSPRNVTVPVAHNQTWQLQNDQPGFRQPSQSPVHNQTWLYTNQTYLSSAPGTIPLYPPEGLPSQVPTSSLWDGSASGIFLADNNTLVGNSSSTQGPSPALVASNHNGSLALALSSNSTRLPLAPGSKPYSSSPYANLVY